MLGNLSRFSIGTSDRVDAYEEKIFNIICKRPLRYYKHVARGDATKSFAMSRQFSPSISEALEYNNVENCLPKKLTYMI